MSRANWVKQQVSSTGVGDIQLADSITSFIRVSSAYVNGEEIYYSLLDGDDRENGLGTYISATNKITRDTIFETLTSGAYTPTGASPISLSGNATLAIMPTPRGLIKHEPVWKELPASSFQVYKAGYTNPDLVTLIGNILAPGFDATIEEAIGIRYNIPHDISVGSSMYPSVRWSPSTTNTGVVRWGIEYSMAERDTGTFLSSTTIFIEQAGGSVTNAHQSIEFADGDKILAPLPNTIIAAKVFRDATHINDTFTGEAILHTASLHYLADYVGTPSRDPDFYVWS